MHCASYKLPFALCESVSNEMPAIMPDVFIIIMDEGMYAICLSKMLLVYLCTFKTRRDPIICASHDLTKKSHVTKACVCLPSTYITINFAPAKTGEEMPAHSAWGGSIQSCKTHCLKLLSHLVFFSRLWKKIFVGGCTMEKRRILHTHVALCSVHFTCVVQVFMTQIFKMKIKSLFYSDYKWILFATSNIRRLPTETDDKKCCRRAMTLSSCPVQQIRDLRCAWVCSYFICQYSSQWRIYYHKRKVTPPWNTKAYDGCKRNCNCNCWMCLR